MQTLQLFVDTDLSAVKKLINDCARDGVLFDSGHIEFAKLRESKQFETTDRVIWIAGNSAIEAARVGDNRTKITLLPVKMYYDGVGMQAWKLISQQLYNAKVIKSLAHLLVEYEKMAFVEDFFLRDTFIKSPRPQLPDEQEFKAAKRAELQQMRGEHKNAGQITDDKIEMIVRDSWNAERERYSRLQEQWDAIHRLAPLTMEQAIADYLKIVPGDTIKKTQARRKVKPTLKTQERAKVFKMLKDEHPEWGYDTVAMKAGEILKEVVTGNSVRNAYKAMRKAYGAEKWRWERADRIR